MKKIILSLIMLLPIISISNAAKAALNTSTDIKTKKGNGNDKGGAESAGW